MRRAPLDPEVISQAVRDVAAARQPSPSPIIVSLRKVGGHLLWKTLVPTGLVSGDRPPFSFLRPSRTFLFFFFLSKHPLPYRH